MRLEAAPAAARDRDDAGRHPDQARDDVEEAVALAEQERRLEDRPVEPGVADQRLGLRLRARVVQRRVVDHAHRAEVDEPADARRPWPRATTLRVPLGVDEPERPRRRPGRAGWRRGGGPRRRRRRAAASDSGSVTSPIRGSTPARQAAGRRSRTPRAGVGVAHERDDAMAGAEQGRDEVAADEAGRAGDQDRGHRPSRLREGSRATSHGRDDARMARAIATHRRA